MTVMRHGGEHLALDTRERQNGQVDRDNNALTKHRGLNHFPGGDPHLVEPFAPRQEASQGMLPLGQVAQAVLDNDHRAIHNEAKVDGTQAHQVAADPRPHHADGRQEHGQRDGQGRDQRGPQVPQEEEQHDNHQEGAFGQVFLHGLDGGVDQLGAVQYRLGLDVRRQALADVGHFGLNGGGDRAAVLAQEHERRAHHHFCPVFAGTAGAQFAAQADRRHVADVDGCALPCAHHNAGNLRLIGNAAVGPHNIGFALVFDIPGTGADVIAFQRLNDLLEREPIGHELHGVGLHVILLDVAPNGVNACHPLDVLELRADNPILHRAQVGSPLQGVGQALSFRGQVGAVGLPARCPGSDSDSLGGGVLDRPHVDLAQPRRDGTHNRLGTRAADFRALP